MNCRGETVKMGVQPGNRRDSDPCPTPQCVAGYACSELAEGWPEDARKDADIRSRSRSFMKYPG